MIEAFLALLVALFVWGPSMAQQGNSGCYLVDHDMAQYRPCKPSEAR